MKIGTRVVVTWLDAHAGADPSAMVSMEEVVALHKPVEVQTYGMLLMQDAVGVSVVAEFFPDSNEFRGRTFVPAGMLIKVEALKVARDRVSRKHKSSSASDAASKAPAGAEEGNKASTSKHS